MTAVTMGTCLTRASRDRGAFFMFPRVQRTILEDPEQRAPLEQRVAAARALGESDPRIGAFVRIEAG
ncbi:MAG: hypothetical protein ACJ78T_06550, partial [Myxococcales bacterium]